MAIFPRLLLTGLLIAFPAMKATSLETAPVPFDAPVPEKWREPFARLLSELGVVDVESTISASKAKDYPQPNFEAGPAKVVFRVVHPNACLPELDECMTFIGHIDGGVFISEAIFYAGDKTNTGDISPRILGVQSSKPVRFFSKASVVIVVKTAKGMLIVSQPLKPSQ